MTPYPTMIRCVLLAMIIMGCIGLSSPTVSNAAFVETHEQTGSFAAAIMYDGALCEGDELAFTAIDVEDRSQEAQGNTAIFEIAYSVTDPDGGDTFDYVQVNLIMQGDQKDSASSSALSDMLTVEKNGGAPHEYTIEIQLYNTSGGLVQEFQTSDAQGGEQPPTAC